MLANAKARGPDLRTESFDPNYYAGANADLSFAVMSPLEHFLQYGWIEGRDPCDWFSCATYLNDYPDVREAHLNPLEHFLHSGRREGRNARPAVRLSDLITEFDSGNGDHISRAIANLICRESYIKAAGLPWFPNPARLNLPRHFLQFSAQTAAHFSIDAMARNVDAIDRVAANLRNIISSGIVASETLLVALRALLNQNADQISPVASSANATLDDHDAFVMQTIRAEFDADFYLERYPELAAANIDPLLHYTIVGWKEGRDPASWFSAISYLRANKDVAQADVNPFYHFIIAGRAEGRRGKKEADLRRQAVESAGLPELDPPSSVASGNAQLSTADLNELLGSRIGSNTKVALSFSHDCYLSNVGGTQILIADEQRRLNEAGYLYLHISPLEARRCLAPETQDYQVQLAVDGTSAGITTMRRVSSAFSSMRPNSKSVAIVHCLLGHSPRAVARVIHACSPERTFFWIHDFSTICAGHNLLRNNVEYCGGPSVDSLACRICVYGVGRAAHLQRIGAFFSSINPIVVSPSAVALEIWRAASGLPSKILAIAPHATIEWRSADRERFRHFCGTGSMPLNVAFVGYPVLHKGWDIFQKLVDEMGDDPKYRFLHLAAPSHNTRMRGVEFIPLEVTSNSRELAVNLMTDLEVDIVVNPSNWPETFSYVTYEAAASGSLVFTIKSAGNAAAVVKEMNIGRVFSDGDDLIDAFRTGEAISLARASVARYDRIGSLRTIGTTAAVIAELDFASTSDP